MSLTQTGFSSITLRKPDAHSDTKPGTRKMRPIVPGYISIAPMIDKTDRHFRWFLRRMSKRAILYTEMITAPAIIHGDRDRLLGFDQVEHPLVLQLGGDDPEEMAQAVRIAEDYGYDEYNINVGCPSDKVQRGSFGACLMAEPDRVARIVDAMAAAANKPVTVKHRIGIRGHGRSLESYEDMAGFVSHVSRAGAERFIVHARIAILEGLSPKDNRNVPPIRYPEVYRLKQDFPHLRVELNGHVKSLAEAAAHLELGVDGVMIGRASYEDAWMVSGIDAFEETHGDATTPNIAVVGPGTLSTKTTSAPATASDAAAIAANRADLVLAFADYIDCQVTNHGLNPRTLVWPMLDLFPGVPGSRKFRQVLSQAFKPGQKMTPLVKQALSHMPEQALKAGPRT